MRKPKKTPEKSCAGSQPAAPRSAGGIPPWEDSPCIKERNVPGNEDSKPKRLPPRQGHIDPENPPYPICGAKKRGTLSPGQKGNPGTICCKSAGWGTTHPGHGKCKLHGGATPPRTATATHSKYAHLSPKYQEVYEDYLKDPDLKNLRPEIAKLRTLVHRFEEEVMNSQVNPIEKYKELSNLLEKITKAIERLDKIEEGRKYLIKIEQWNQGISAVAQILKEEIQETRLLDRIIYRFRQIPLLPPPSEKVDNDSTE